MCCRTLSQRRLSWRKWATGLSVGLMSRIVSLRYTHWQSTQGARKRLSWRHFLIERRLFAQTGSGQTRGDLRRSDVFSCSVFVFRGDVYAAEVSWVNPEMGGSGLDPPREMRSLHKYARVSG
jgi:hypothetical protein